MTGIQVMKTAVRLLEAILLVSLLATVVNALSPPAKITFSGGPGDTPETAVIILGPANSITGIGAEYDWLSRKFGQKNVDWRLKRQSVMQQKGKVYDRMEIELKDGNPKTVFFDISEFFGKL